MTLGQTIRERRQLLKLSQFELAKKVGITQSQICKIEADISKPSYVTLILISKVLRCNINNLTKGEFKNE